MLSMFDKLWHPALTEAEAFEMMRKGVEEVRGLAGCWRVAFVDVRVLILLRRCGGALCSLHLLLLRAPQQSALVSPELNPRPGACVPQVKSRLVVAPPKYLVKVIDAKGIRTLGEL